MSEKFFSEVSFFEKIGSVFTRAGKELIRFALQLYYVLEKPEVPLKVKTIIISSLGYFIMPLDLIPDIIVPIGYSDDLAVLTSALTVAAIYIDHEVRQKAEQQLQRWFG